MGVGRVMSMAGNEFQSQTNNKSDVGRSSGS